MRPSVKHNGTEIEVAEVWQIRMERDFKREAKAFARRLGISGSEMVREAVRRMISTEEAGK